MSTNATWISLCTIRPVSGEAMLFRFEDFFGTRLLCPRLLCPRLFGLYMHESKAIMDTYQDVAKANFWFGKKCDVPQSAVVRRLQEVTKSEDADRSACAEDSESGAGPFLSSGHMMQLGK